MHDDRSLPASIEAALDNELLGYALTETRSPEADSDATYHFSVCLGDWADGCIRQSLDMARRGELEVTPADVLKAAEWARKVSSRGEVYHQDAIDVLTTVAELFAKPMQEKREKDRERRRQKATSARSTDTKAPPSKRSKRPRPTTVARRKPKARAKAKAA
jgi:hypothetical protein